MYSHDYHALAWLSCNCLAIMHSSGYHVLAWLSCTRLAIVHSPSYSFLLCVITLSAMISLGHIDLSGLPYLSQDTKPTSLVPCIFLVIPCRPLAVVHYT
jgi:hypothetical protein